ncbi:MAG: hypothetical protein SF029_06225 [bacterium]|nr:hypothetical protein [bacterium]
MKSIKYIMWFLLVLCVSPVLAQRATCPAIVEAALRTVDQLCRDTGRNQACYGNVSLEAIARPQAEDFQFSQVGDIENVEWLESLRLDSMDEEAGTWGVAMMRLQANLPDTLPGQNVTFLLFGDVEITNAVSGPIDPMIDHDEAEEESTPMQAFYLRSGIGDAPCAEAPQSGLLVQTPHGVGEISFTMNGVEVSLGSTVFFQAGDEGVMNVTTVEGSAALTIEGESYPVLAGTYLSVPIDENFEPAGEPEAPKPYVVEQLVQLPVQNLEREITVAPPMPQERINQVIEMIENGQAPCGQEGLPDCDQLPDELGGTPCVLPGSPEASSGAPVCEVTLEPEATEEAPPSGQTPGGPNTGPEQTPGVIPLPPLPQPTPEATANTGSAPGNPESTQLPPGATPTPEPTPESGINQPSAEPTLEPPTYAPPPTEENGLTPTPEQTPP